MKIITTSSFYIVNKGVFGVGQIIEINDELAKKLIEQGVAEQYIEEQEKEEDNEIEDVITEDKVEEEKIDYNKLKVSELKELLKERNIEIPKGSKKADLINLLSE